jgi:general secretion pathway protein G
MKKKIIRIILTVFFTIIVVYSLLWLSSVLLIPKFSTPEDDMFAARERPKRILERFDLYHLECGEYPRNFQDLLTAPEHLLDVWQGPYIMDFLRHDPWGRKYIINITEDQIDIYSLGPDGKPNTEDDIRVTNKEDSQDGVPPPEI